MFSIKLARRNSQGIPIPGQFVEFETNNAAELEEFYEKHVLLSRAGKRHPDNNNQRKRQRGDSKNVNDTRLPEGDKEQ